MNLANQILNGDRLALARAISQIENNIQAGQDVLDQLFKYSGNAHLIGITGPSGAGKSTLVNALVKRLLFQNNKKPIGVIAIDPTSPFTGGAFLGDRIRMRDISSNPNVFVRSMATRGALGGLTSTTVAVAVILDAAGYDPVIIETVGTGQAEVDIARLAHTTLVVEAPGLGDDIQAIKAGILEIADILVVNKADLPGAEATKRALHSMLQLAHPVPHVFCDYAVDKPGHILHNDLQEMEEKPDSPSQNLWIPPVQLTVATQGTGVAELVESIDRHYDHLVKTGELQRREQVRLHSELDLLLRETLISRWRATVIKEQYESILQQLMRREISPWQAIQSLLDGSDH